jgi:peroxiredoxin
MTKVTVILAMALITVVLVGIAGCSPMTTPPATLTATQSPNPAPLPGPVAANETTKNTPSIKSSPAPESTPVIEIGPQVGKLAPDFNFTDAEGKSTSLSGLRGRSIVLNFWATWCGPCKYEMPLLQDLADDQEKAEKGLILLTVDSGESADTVRRFIKASGFSFPVLLDSQSIIYRAYKVRAIPTTFFIGQDGIISYIRVGAFMNKSQLEEILNKILK